MSHKIKKTIEGIIHHSYEKLKIWVLFPQLESSDQNIDYYYDFSQSLEEYKRVFNEWSMNWVWQPINLSNHLFIINEIASEKKTGAHIPIVLNLCDGDEINGAPGISIIRALEKNALVYTGADAFFYSITTSKIPMKKAFDEMAVATPRWLPVFSSNIDAEVLFKNLGTPIIIKPAVSGGSMGVGIKNVIEEKEELSHKLHELFNGYRGWDLSAEGFIAEEFIVGPEFTTFLCGEHDKPNEATIFTPVERVFHASLPEKEKFLSFDRLWEIYENESPMPNQENFYEYQIPESRLVDAIKKISWDAFVANKGVGYARIDIRMDKRSEKLYVLETNAQCGISEDENFTSIGAILKVSKKSFSEIIEEILIQSITRHKNYLLQSINE